jgi:hypothetical protein
VSPTRALLARLDAPLAVVLLAAVALTALLTARIATAGGPSGLVVAGDAFVTTRSIKVNEHSTGYDGQFVYRLTLDPFTHRTTDGGVTLDNPPYRQQRLGLPLLAHATHLPPSVALIVINALALLAATWAGATLAKRHGRHAAWGLLLGLSPALVVAVTRDLTEPLAAALLLLGLVAWPEHPWRAATLFTGAVLTRETTLAVLAGLGAYALWQRRPKQVAALLVPLAAFLAWQAHLRQVWGTWPFRSNNDNVGTPFTRTFASLLDLGTDKRALEYAWLAERLALLAFLAYVAYALTRRAADAWTAAFVLAALLALSARWYRDVAFLRVANEAILVGTLVLLTRRTRAANVALIGVGATSAFVAALYGLVL